MTAAQALQKIGLAEIEAAAELSALDAVRVKFLGKKGLVTDALKTLGTLSESLRREAGLTLNATRDALNTAIAQRREILTEQDMFEALNSSAVDITLPGRGQRTGGLHPVTLALERMVGIFRRAGFEVATGPEIENDFYNFEALNIPRHHPARALHDTFYFPDGLL